jgi:hypothetical protein
VRPGEGIACDIWSLAVFCMWAIKYQVTMAEIDAKYAAAMKPRWYVK